MYETAVKYKINSTMFVNWKLRVLVNKYIIY